MYDEYDDDFNEKPSASFQHSKEDSQLAHVFYDREEEFDEKSKLGK